METVVKILRTQGDFNPDDLSTPLKIPRSLSLQRLGCSTEIELIRLKRRPLDIGGTSPWDVKWKNKKKLVDTTLNGLIFIKHFHPNIGINNFYSSSLDWYLEKRFKKSKGPLAAKLINKICFDISQALDFLHNKVRQIHGNIQTSRILLFDDKFDTFQLADICVCQPYNENGFIDVKQSALCIGIDLWSAPEVIKDPTRLSIKSDVFSFGMAIYEMLSIQPPHTLNNDVSYLTERFNESGDTGLGIPLGTRPALPDDIEFSSDYHDILGLFYACTQSDPESRPTAKMINELMTVK